MRPILLLQLNILFTISLNFHLAAAIQAFIRILNHINEVLLDHYPDSHGYYR